MIELSNLLFCAPKSSSQQIICLFFSCSMKHHVFMCTIYWKITLATCSHSFLFCSLIQRPPKEPIPGGRTDPLIELVTHQNFVITYTHLAISLRSCNVSNRFFISYTPTNLFPTGNESKCILTDFMMMFLHNNEKSTFGFSVLSGAL